MTSDPTAALRDAMARLNRESTPQLRILYARATAQRAEAVTRDRMIKFLATRAAAAPPVKAPAPGPGRAAPAFAGEQVFASGNGSGRAKRPRRV